MEETLGKRIAAHRKRLKMTQDQLAEQLGVTAQAVSKWENNLSCPDIGILPQLAAIFGTSVDSLLGCEPQKNEIIHEAEVIHDEESKSDGICIQKGQWELHLDNNKKDAVGLALWVLLCGSVMLATRLMDQNLSFWNCLWTTALLTFGLFGLFPDFSVFRLGCALFGGYFLLEYLQITSLGLSGKLVFPICLLLFGLGLLVEAMKKSKKSKFEIHNSRHQAHVTSCNLGEDSFQCVASFGTDTYPITLPRLTHGQIDLSFGDLTVDLRDCREIAPNCSIHIDCAFGEVKLLVPRHYQIKANPSSTFGAFGYQGDPDPASQGTILLDANVSFGEIQVVYI